jgi:ORF6N domain
VSDHGAVEKPVECRIVTIREQKVLLDADIAELYGVSVRQLNQQIKRNPDRFPRDFAFRLTNQELTGLKSQIVTSNIGRGGRRKLPLAFTEHGAIMAATVLNSPRAVQMSVFVVRAFLRLREMLTNDRDLAEKVAELERRVDSHDDAIQQIIFAIKKLMEPSGRPLKQIGFRPEVERKPKALKAQAQQS